MVTSLPPMPTRTTKRVTEQRRRWRLLYGKGEMDIAARLKQSIGDIRKDAWGPIDLTSNPFLSVWSQAAATYRSEPIVATPEGWEHVAEAIAESGHWSVMQRVQRDTLALREMMVRIDWDEEEGLSTYPVAPFLVDVDVHPRFPRRATVVREWRPDPDDETNEKWVQVIFDPASLVHKALDEDGNDVSGRVLGGNFSGENYPFMGPDGPILPWVTYRASLTGSFWDCFTGREVVEGTLQLGVFYTLFGHLIKDCSWQQRYIMGAEPAGAVPNPETGVSELITDPSTVMVLQQVLESKQTLIGQWSAVADPEVVLRAIQAYERRLVDNAIGTANVSRANSDIRSGYSLAVDREDQRELQRSYGPVFMRSDVDLLSKVSALMCGPTSGYGLEYRAVPKDPREVAAEQERLSKAIEAGLMSKVQAYQVLHPLMDEAQATKAIAEIAEINRRFAA